MSARSAYVPARLPVKHRGLQLVKWYADVVAPDGRGAIAYWAELTWHGVRGRAGSVITFGPDEPTTERVTLTPGEAPSQHGFALEWGMPALDASVFLHDHEPGPEVRLRTEGTGRLDWHCVAPHGLARMEVGGRRIEGLGYAECLSSTLPPWRLPVESVHWGRALFRTRSVVWLRWIGAEPLNVLLVDGRRVLGTVEPGGAALPDGERLELDTPHVIRSGTIAEALRPLRVLWPLLPQAFRTSREDKWLARAHLLGPHGELEAGWAIHELVTLRH